MGAPSLLILVSSDPRQTGRTAEAVRLAAGVAAWKKVRVSLYFSGPALLALKPETFDFVDGDNFSQYFPLLSELGMPVYVPAGSEELSNPELPIACQGLDTGGLARLAAQTSYVMHF